ncbi:DUF4349 domain-containing protein [Streptomyces sp. NPDC051322]|uniref:DUF4349 domain-containing protein n=1 Tax=Streptomyces sp. NPDC051322 TaxID=3154645 RepID=UPI00344E5589
MRAARILAAVLLTASVAVGGCGAAGDNGGSSSAHKAAADSAGGAARPAGGSAATGSGSGAGPAAKPSGKTPSPIANKIIRTAELSVEVKDTEKALNDARTAAEDAGGFVGNESTERDGGGQVRSTVVLRVPQDKYDAVLSELQGSGTLLSRKADAEDVTDQVVDVKSRIASQRASVARVRTLMDQADQLSDVVSLEGELSSREAELESLLAQQASLRDRTDLATITLNLSEPAKNRQTKEEKKDDGPGFLDALGGGWHAFVVVLKWIVIVVAAVAPFAAVIAAFWLLRRLLGKRLPQLRKARPAAGGNVPPPAHVPSQEETRQQS